MKIEPSRAPEQGQTMNLPRRSIGDWSDGSEILLLINHEEQNGDLFDEGTSESYKKLLKRIKKYQAFRRCLALIKYLHSEWA